MYESNYTVPISALFASVSVTPSGYEGAAAKATTLDDVAKNVIITVKRKHRIFFMYTTPFPLYNRIQNL